MEPAALFDALGPTTRPPSPRRPFRGTSFDTNGWRRAVEQAGLEIIAERSKPFVPRGHDSDETEEHLLLLARRPGGEETPVILAQVGPAWRAVPIGRLGGQGAARRLGWTCGEVSATGRAEVGRQRCFGRRAPRWRIRSDRSIRPRAAGPRQPFRRGGLEWGPTMQHTLIDSPLGDVLIAASDEGLSAVHFVGGGPGPRVVGERGMTPLLETAHRQLEEYFEQERTEFELPLAPRGEPFQLKVWELLREIPYGRTWSYGDLARRLGGVEFSQAVGAANGRNPLAVVVPCHRVIGADGSLTGYAGGLNRKRYLLALEEPSPADAGRLF